MATLTLTIFCILLIICIATDYSIFFVFIPAASVGLIDKKITGTIVKLKK